MFNWKDLFRWNIKISDYIEVKKYWKQFLLDNPDYFHITGITIFSGKQGSGKTLSAVDYVEKLHEMFPKALIVSNIHLKNVDYIKYKGIDSLTDINNDDKGVIYLIDEIHLEWNSLESKSIPIEVFTEISQQRKQRNHIIGTSQLFERVAKPFREQVDKVVLCKNHLGGRLQFNYVTEGESITRDIKGELRYKVLKRHVFFHNEHMYDAYDTFEKVQRYKDMRFNGNVDLYEKGEPMYFYERGKKS